MKWTAASDVDGTLTGDREALDRLRARLGEKRAAGEPYSIVSTGRRLEQVTQGIREEGLPEPDAVICQVGTEIYLPRFPEQSPPMDAWRTWLLGQYSRDQALLFLAGIEGLVMQPDEYNTELKTSCYRDQCADPEKTAEVIRNRVRPHRDRYQVVWSSGRDLDILPAASGNRCGGATCVSGLLLTTRRPSRNASAGKSSTPGRSFPRSCSRGSAACAVGKELGVLSVSVTPWKETGS